MAGRRERDAACSRFGAGWSVRTIGIGRAAIGAGPTSSHIRRLTADAKAGHGSQIAVFGVTVAFECIDRAGIDGGRRGTVFATHRRSAAARGCEGASRSRSRPASACNRGAGSGVRPCSGRACAESGIRAAPNAQQDQRARPQARQQLVCHAAEIRARSSFCNQRMGNIESRKKRAASSEKTQHASMLLC